MTLVAKIKTLVEQGVLPRVWTTRDLVACAPLAADYPVTTLRTDPPNRSSSPCETVHGALASSEKPSPYIRFKPSPALGKGIRFCVREHYRPGIDPMAYDAVEATEFVVTGPSGAAVEVARQAWKAAVDTLTLLKQQGAVAPDEAQRLKAEAYRDFLRKAASPTEFDLFHRETGERVPLFRYRDHVLADTEDPQILAQVQFLNTWRSTWTHHETPIEALLAYHSATGGNAYSTVTLDWSGMVSQATETVDPVGDGAHYASFREIFSTALERIDACLVEIELLGRRGWSQQLAGYHWAGDWRVGIQSREENAEAMEAFLMGSQSFTAVSAQIVNQWGGISQKLPPELEGPVRATIAQLLTDPDRRVEEGMCGMRIASLSKLYAAAAPERWVIYDSRVAAAITYLLEKAGLRRKLGSYFGTLKGKSPKLTRVLPGFPAIHATSHKRAFRAFVHASWLCRALAERLNARHEPLPEAMVGEWKAYHVEMVLFMIGYDLKILPRL